MHWIADPFKSSPRHITCSPLCTSKLLGIILPLVTPAPLANKFASSCTSQSKAKPGRNPGSSKLKFLTLPPRSYNGSGGVGNGQSGGTDKESVVLCSVGSPKSTHPFT